MSAQRAKRTVTHSKLIPWELEIPGIWFRYSDGDEGEVVSDARVRTPDVIEAIKRLGSSDRAKLKKLLEENPVESLHSIT